MDKSFVVHLRKSRYDIRIDRQTKWGNPFVIPRDGDRDTVIRKYREWVVTQPHLVAALPELRGKVLGCWCAPLPCHGDVLVELANRKEVNMEQFIVAGTGSRSLAISEDKDRMSVVLDAEVVRLKNKYPGLVFMSGMAEGWDELIARKAVEHSVPLIAAVPNKTYGAYYWRDHSVMKCDRMAEYLALLDAAEEVVFVCKGVYENGIHANFVRNTYMVNRANAFLVYDTGSPGTRDAIRKIKVAGKPYKVLS